MNNVSISWSDVEAIKAGLNARPVSSEYVGRTGCTGSYGWSGEVFDVILRCQKLWPRKAKQRDGVAWTKHKRELEERLNREVELYVIQKQMKERERIAQMEQAQRHQRGQAREEVDALRSFPPMLRAPALSMS